jgi:hypothetical protein
VSEVFPEPIFPATRIRCLGMIMLLGWMRVC